MSKNKVEVQLNECPYCGGKGELKTKRRASNLTVSYNRQAVIVERFIRCKKCHARTRGFGKIINCVNQWNTGFIYPIQGRNE